MLRVNRREFLRLAGWSAAGLALASCQPADKPSQSLPAVEETVEAVRNSSGIPGISVGLIRDGRLIYARGFGVRNIATGEPMTEKTVVCFTRIAMSFTAAAIMQLVEAGKVTLDDPYVQHVPYFEMADPRYTEITIRHLLAHTSGIRMMPALESDFLTEWADRWNGDDAAERLVRSLKEDKLNQDPGGKLVSWSDLGYDLLAALIQEVSGETFEAYQREHILKPLAMTSSTFLLSEVKPEELAAPHISQGGQVAICERYPYARQHASSCGLFSNVVDLSHWLLAAMSGGAYRNKRILKPESQAWLWEPLSLYSIGYLGTEMPYNSGWAIDSYQEGDEQPARLIYTDGAGPGSEVFTYIFPEQGLASIAVGNRLDSFGAAGPIDMLAEILVKKMYRGEL